MRSELSIDGGAVVVWSDDDGSEGIGCSDDSRRRVSAATIPPIEWPTRKTWTEGSTVGDAVRFATSKSMT